MTHAESTSARPWRPHRKTNAQAGNPFAAIGEGAVVAARFERRGVPPVAEPDPELVPPPASPPPSPAPNDSDRLQRAFQEGVEEGRRQERADRLADEVIEAGGFLLHFRAAAVEVLLELTGAVAERLVGREFERDPAEVGRHVAHCLQRLPPNGPLKLRLHPQDREALLRRTPRPEWLTEDEGRLRLLADESLGRGECVVESERGRVDGRRAASLDAAREVLRDLLAQAFAGDRA